MLLLASCAAPRLPPAEATVWIPQAADDTGRALYSRICRPALTEGRTARVVVINHGASFGADRLAMQPQACSTEAARWFLDRGFIVVFPMRRGYGPTGGELSETSGPCDAPDYLHAGLAGAADIDAVVRYATGLPEARPSQAVVIGQSVGGWAVLAYDSLPHPQANTLIAMAPGRGGWAGGVPGRNCRPDLLAATARTLAATATTPVLWLNALNDSYYPPPVTDQMIAAWRAGGGQVEVARFGPFGTEGHALFQGLGGSTIWGEAVERVLGMPLPAS